MNICTGDYFIHERTGKRVMLVEESIPESPCEGKEVLTAVVKSPNEILGKGMGTVTSFIQDGALYTGNMCELADQRIIIEPYEAGGLYKYASVGFPNWLWKEEWLKDFRTERR